MENKKLLKILVKDMSELEELISEAKTRGTFDAMEMEFLHTRAKGIVQILNMFNGFEAPVQKEIEEKPDAVVEEIEAEKREEIIEVSPKNVIHEEIENEKIEEVVQQEIEVAETKVVEKDETPAVESKNEVELEEEGKDSELIQRLGDSF